jgi:hypothetical protein
MAAKLLKMALTFLIPIFQLPVEIENIETT